MSGRRVDVVTVGRSDWGIWRPVVRALRDAGAQVRVLIGGAHHLASHGHGAVAVRADAAALGAVAVDVDFMAADSDAVDGAAAVAASVGKGVAAFAAAYAADRPDVVCVLGDRSEMFAAAVAAVPFVLPIAHIHGGERTAGAIDDVWRHAITKMAHLHFVAAPAYGARVRQLGEEPWRVHVVGAPALDELLQAPAVDDVTVADRAGVDVDDLHQRRTIVCTFHPVTLEPGSARAQADAVIGAIEDVVDDEPCGRRSVVFTMPNADVGGRAVRDAIAGALARRPQFFAHESLGLTMYGALLRRAGAVVGNSSSGIIEAPALGVPVVNIGARQAGRARAASVVDVDCDRAAIAAALRAALTPDARARAAATPSVYGQGTAAPAIAAVLVGVALDARLTQKDFVDFNVDFNVDVNDRDGAGRGAA